MNNTKTSISVMFCGSAAGESLPPFVVYKSINMWDTWAQNGPWGLAMLILNQVGLRLLHL